jgi:type II secretory pathway pseudopilin PulG
MITMKCDKCGFENKDNSKFCTKCGNSLEVSHTPKPQGSDNTKYVIVALVAVIVILAAAIGYFALNMNSGSVQADDVQNNASSATQAVSESSSGGGANSQSSEAASSSPSPTTQVVDSKSWESIGSYSGSGSGSQTINVPAGKIMVKLSAFPIKNYATNHLYVTGSNGQSGGVDWGPTSDVETRSDSFEYTSSNSETFTIDYNETVSWEVEFFRYQ